MAEDSFADKWLKVQIVKDYVAQKLRSYEAELAAVRQQTANAAQHLTNVAAAKNIFIRNGDREKEIQYNMKRFQKIYDAVMKEEAAMRDALIVEYMKKLDIVVEVEKR